VPGIPTPRIKAREDGQADRRRQGPRRPLASSRGHRLPELRQRGRAPDWGDTRTRTGPSPKRRAGVLSTWLHHRMRFGQTAGRTCLGGPGAPLRRADVRAIQATLSPQDRTPGAFAPRWTEARRRGAEIRSRSGSWTEPHDAPRGDDTFVRGAFRRAVWRSAAARGLMCRLHRRQTAPPRGSRRKAGARRRLLTHVAGNLPSRGRTVARRSAAASTSVSRSEDSRTVAPGPSRRCETSSAKVGIRLTELAAGPADELSLGLSMVAAAAPTRCSAEARISGGPS